VPRVTHWRGYDLNDFQVRAIEAIAAGHNVLVGAPTGAGKTLVAEYAIEDAIRARRRCIYTSPIKALSNQKYRDFRDDPRVDVGLLTGDVTIHPTAQVLIMTTEILRNAIFEDPRQLADVEYVVFDEVHFLDDAERGTVWEESLIFAPPGVRFICLSATVSNIGELGAWIDEIREQELVVIESRTRPVPLTHQLYHPSRGVFELGELPKVRRRALERAEHRGRAGRSRGRRGRNARDAGWNRPPAEPTDTRRLLDQLQAERLLPVLVFSFSRKDCERLAAQNSRRDLLSPEEHAAMGELQAQLVRVFQLDRGELDGEILSMARRGIGYHHAGMLPIHKELVERMFTSGLLKMLFTTETFALGINMPARAVVFQSLRKFDGVSVDYLRTREYMQMAGRAGRQGIDESGLVFSVLDERDLAEAPLKRILSGEPEPVESRFHLSYSSLLHLLSSLGRARLHEAWEKSFHQFQHREKSEKSREKVRARQRALLEAHLAFLDDQGFVEGGETLTPKGRTAQKLNGYEVQITELLFRGALENLPPSALAMVFVALVYEERRRGRPPFIPQRMFAGVRRHVTQLLVRLLQREAQFDIPSPLKLPDWGLTPAVLAWCDGRVMAEMEQVTDVTPGDLCRTFRMSIQLLRQVRRAIDPAWDLGEQLAQAQALLNRDEIDARRQLELG
jgi:superfamily II RNA helicase